MRLQRGGARPRSIRGVGVRARDAACRAWANARAHRVRWAVVACVLIACYVGYRWRTYDPFDAIAYRTLRALERHDAEALMAMADPIEVKDTGLTARGVRVALEATLWQDGVHERLRIVPHRYRYSNRRTYDVVPHDAGDGPGHWRIRMPIFVQQLGSDKPIVLRLSCLVRMACEARHPAGVPTDAPKCGFTAVAAKAGIRAYWDFAGNRTAYPSGERTRVFDDL